jgi:hypothetical protein
MFVFYRDQVEVAGPVRGRLLLFDALDTALSMPVARLPFVGAVAAPNVTVGATQHSRVDRFRGLAG